MDIVYKQTQPGLQNTNFITCYTLIFSFWGSFFKTRARRSLNSFLTSIASLCCDETSTAAATAFQPHILSLAVFVLLNFPKRALLSATAKMMAKISSSVKFTAERFLWNRAVTSAGPHKQRALLLYQRRQCFGQCLRSADCQLYFKAKF